MIDYAISADGTRIAYQRLGSGPALILAAGLLCDRETLHELAAVLAKDFTVFNFDRRGRGQSGDTKPYAVAREIEDVAALIDAAGGRASLYGHSSGAGLMLLATAAGLQAEKLILHEPPYGGDDEASRESAKGLAEQIRDALRLAKGDEAVRMFFAATGMPDEFVDMLAGDPKRRALAQTMTNDFEVMGEFEGGGIPEALARSIAVPTLAIAGSESPDFFRETAERLERLLPNGRLEILDGHDHGAAAGVVAPVVARFLNG
ncbi:MAG TPA: alpha/beta hydrolase [Rhizobiaceae bacterium]|nr:alpha/beta hydrolase [Rhizobiaceae bacterium]